MTKLSIDTPNELVGILNEIFPEYVLERDEDDMSDLSYHEVLQDFIYFYGKNNSAFTEHQIKSFAIVITRAVEAGGNIENAFSTCFLEHLGQINSLKPLVSFLSHAAKERLHT